MCVMTQEPLWQPSDILTADTESETETPKRRGRIPQSAWPRILERYKAGTTLSAIAREFDCTPSAISYIVRKAEAAGLNPDGEPGETARATAPDGDGAPPAMAGAQPAPSPAAEGAVAERPVAERPAVERPVVERPVVERQAAERPAADAGRADRPAADPAPAAVEPRAAARPEARATETAPAMDTAQDGQPGGEEAPRREGFDGRDRGGRDRRDRPRQQGRLDLSARENRAPQESRPAGEGRGQGQDMRPPPGSQPLQHNGDPRRNHQQGGNQQGGQRVPQQGRERFQQDRRAERGQGERATGERAPGERATGERATGERLQLDRSALERGGGDRMPAVENPGNERLPQEQGYPYRHQHRNPARLEAQETPTVPADQRMETTAASCADLYRSWKANPGETSMQALADSLHEMRKVIARMEIEMSANRKDEQRPIPVPSYRINQPPSQQPRG